MQRSQCSPEEDSSEVKAFVLHFVWCEHVVSDGDKAGGGMAVTNGLHEKKEGGALDYKIRM